MTGGALLLVRHGESTWNAAGLLQGHTAHVPLSARGRGQAARAAARLAGRPVAAVLSSDQARAVETAVAIAAAHRLAVHAEPALREQGHGVWEGRRAAGRAALLAAAGPDWAPAGGETGRALQARVAGFLDRLRADRRLLGPGPHRPPAGDVVLVTHGETIRALRAVLTGDPGPLPGNGEIVTVAGWRAGVPPGLPVAGDAALLGSV